MQVNPGQGEKNLPSRRTRIASTTPAAASTTPTAAPTPTTPTTRTTSTGPGTTPAPAPAPRVPRRVPVLQRRILKAQPLLGPRSALLRPPLRPHVELGLGAQVGEEHDAVRVPPTGDLVGGAHGQRIDGVARREAVDDARGAVAGAEAGSVGRSAVVAGARVGGGVNACVALLVGEGDDDVVDGGGGGEEEEEGEFWNHFGEL